MSRRSKLAPALAWVMVAACSGEASLPQPTVGPSQADDPGPIRSRDAGAASDAAGGAFDVVTEQAAAPPSSDAQTGHADAERDAPDTPTSDGETRPMSGHEAGGPVQRAGAAFPGALGFGRSATGGAGGTVVHVTNLKDAGPGSFRDAVSAPGRIVVFDVGGYIVLASPVSVNSNITIAGQTAPGDGIGIMGNEVSFSSRSNVIVRYMRFRQGCTSCNGSSDPDFKRSGINFAASSTMIMDHVSIEFAQWNNIDAVGATNITFQYSIDANPIGQQFAAHTEMGPFSWIGNLFVNSHNRNPLAKANTQYVNNVVYDYQAGYTAGNTGGTFQHDIIGNYFIAGPATTNASSAFFQVNNQPMFNSGNWLDGNTDGTLNGSVLTSIGGTSLGAAWSPATSSLPMRTAAAAYAAAIADAGASLHRDEVDALVVADVTSLGKKGHLWTSPAQTGLVNSGFGALNGGAAATDTDGDGMPDAWEARYGLDPKSPADAHGDFDHTGYTNIEKYINGLADGEYPTR